VHCHLITILASSLGSSHKETMERTPGRCSANSLQRLFLSAMLCCLRMRSEAGFIKKLERLEVQRTGKHRDVGCKAEDFRSLVDVFVYSEASIQLWEIE